MAQDRENPITVCILGMHRSGTSCLTGCLEDAGVFLGEVSRRNDFNVKGNRENKDVRSLHDVLLKENGGGWDEPPPRVTWKKKHKKTRDRIIRGFSNHPIWGFKDPRTLLTLNGWLEALPDLKFAGIFRDPLLVARSLKRRNALPLERGMDLWCLYNRKLIQYHDLFGFPLVSFDEDPFQFTEKVRRLITLLGLGLDTGNVDFFRPELRHVNTDEHRELPDQCRQIYDDLRERAI